MLFLITAIICSSGVALTLRYSGKHEKSSHMTLTANYVVSALLCLVFMTEKKLVPVTPDMRIALYLGLINGALYLVTLIINRVNIEKNGTPLTASFSHLGVLIPTLLSIIVFGDQPNGLQWFGVFMAVTAIIIINLPTTNEKRIPFPIGLILLFVGGGCADMMSKVFEHFKIPDCDSLFLFYTFFVALILCVIWGLFKKEPFAFRDIIYGVVLGGFNYSSTMFLLKAVLVLPAFLVYPVYSVGVIVFINLVNRFFLKETITRRQYLGMALICVALVFLNLG